MRPAYGFLFFPIGKCKQQCEIKAQRSTPPPTPKLHRSAADLCNLGVGGVDLVIPREGPCAPQDLVALVLLQMWLSLGKCLENLELI